MCAAACVPVAPGYMSLDTLTMEVLASQEIPEDPKQAAKIRKEKKQAAKVQKVKKHHNLLLVTLVRRCAVQRRRRACRF